MIYQIIDWNVHYENDRSRTRDSLSWCGIPNKRGLSRGLLLKYQNGAAIYGCFLAIVLNICSKQARPRDGWLTSNGLPDGRPLSSSEINMLTDMPIDLIRLTLDTLTSNPMNWIRGHVTALPPDPPSTHSQFTLDGKGEEGIGRERETAAAHPPLHKEKPSSKNQDTKPHSFKHSPYFDQSVFAAALPGWDHTKVQRYYDAALAHDNNGGTKKDWIQAVKIWANKDERKIAKPGHPAPYRERSDNVIH
jgi:hypothetical protein